MNNDRSPTPTEQTLDALVDSLAHLHEQLTALAALALALDDRPLARSLRRMHDALGAAGGRAVTLRHREDADVVTRLDGPRLQLCRSCRAMIFYAVTDSGRVMPVDAEPVEDGRLVLSHDGTNWAVQVGPRHASRERYRPHFATCPDAGRWRRGR